MGGFEIDKEVSANPKISGHEIARLSKQLRIPCQYDEKTIKDKSKSDAFAKGLAVIQILQLVLSLIVRKIRGLEISQLEIVTLVFAVCGVATFISCWHKPRNVAVALPLGFRSVPENLEKPFDSFSRVLVSRVKDSNGRRVPNDNIPIHSFYNGSVIWVLAFLSAAIGTLHVIAWNFEFPTLAERIAWRVTTIVSVVVPPLGLVTVLLSQHHRAWGDPREFMEQTLRILEKVQEMPDSIWGKYLWLRHGDLKDSLETTKPTIDKIVEEAYDHLQRISNIEATSREAKVRYQAIFCWMIENSYILPIIDILIKNSLQDIGQREHPRWVVDNLTVEYALQYNWLLGLMNGHGSAKMVEEAPWTNVYPRKEVLGALNQLIVYSTGIIYCLARLVILALTISSLRAMPDGVYTTTWTKYIPVLQ